jgi:hypothetical protein
MIRRVSSWVLLVIVAALCHVCFRYWAGDFQGHLTFPINGTEYGFAHIKSSTVWVSGRGFTHLPGVLAPLCFLSTLVALVFVVRLVYKSSVQKKHER